MTLVIDIYEGSVNEIRRTCPIGAWATEEAVEIRDHDWPREGDTDDLSGGHELVENHTTGEKYVRHFVFVSAKGGE